MTDTTISPSHSTISPPWRTMSAGLAIAFFALAALEGFMMIPASAFTPAIGGVLLWASFVAILKHSKELKGSEGWIMSILVFVLASLIMVLISYTRGDREIGPESYSSMARTLRERPELNGLIVEAKADGIITNAESSRFDHDVVEFDKSKILGR